MLRLALIGLVAIGAAACTTVPASPGETSEAAADPAPQAASPQAEKICRDLSTTGSYGPRHVCHTREQWEKIDAMS
jgi:hypothetical protein